VGGLVASLIMNEFQNLWACYAEETKAKSAAKKTRKTSSEKEPATVKEASAISEEVFAHKLTKSEKKSAAGRACDS
jgi:hypothetical protein